MVQTSSRPTPTRTAPSMRWGAVWAGAVLALALFILATMLWGALAWVASAAGAATQAHPQLPGENPSPASGRALEASSAPPVQRSRRSVQQVAEGGGRRRN